MFRVRLIVFVAVAMAFAQLQCVAACAGDLCGADLGQTESVPPCHEHHDQAPGSCSFHLIVMPAAVPHAAHSHIPVFSVLGLAATVSSILPVDGDSCKATLSAPSPPGTTAPLSSIVLRV